DRKQKQLVSSCPSSRRVAAHAVDTHANAYYDQTDGYKTARRVARIHPSSSNPNSTQRDAPELLPIRPDNIIPNRDSRYSAVRSKWLLPDPQRSAEKNRRQAGHKQREPVDESRIKLPANSSLAHVAGYLSDRLSLGQLIHHTNWSIVEADGSHGCEINAASAIKA